VYRGDVGDGVMGWWGVEVEGQLGVLVLHAWTGGWRRRRRGTREGGGERSSRGRGVMVSEGALGRWWWWW